MEYKFNRFTIYSERVKRGWTQIDLAKKIGCSNVVICHWENGKRIPSLKHVMDLAKVLDIPIEMLFTNIDESNTGDDKNVSKSVSRTKRSTTKRS